MIPKYNLFTLKIQIWLKIYLKNQLQNVRVFWNFTFISLIEYKLHTCIHVHYTLKIHLVIELCLLVNARL